MIKVINQENNGKNEIQHIKKKIKQVGKHNHLRSGKLQRQ